MSKYLIAIPARYESTRFPGKPLEKIAGKEMILRVYENAKKAAANFGEEVRVVVATQHQLIKDFCDANNMEWVNISYDCKNGSEAVLEAAENIEGEKPEFIINLQGDNPLCPPWFVEDMLNAYKQSQDVALITPCVKMTWEQLDALRESKKTTPFSGTTCILDNDNYAIWFSKNIIPALRPEAQLREESDTSPVHRHIGLYGYKYEPLKKYVSLPMTDYEKLEGLEQLRFLENGMKIKVVVVDYKGYGSMSGVDSPEDVGRAEALLAKHGEFK